MATETITSFDDLLALLEQNPQYRSRLRQSILDEEFQRLPQQVNALTEQTRTLGEVTATLTERIDQLTGRVDQLAERMDQLTERVDQMAEQMREHSELFKDILLHLKSVDARFVPLEQRMDRLIGDEAERRFRGRAPAYFGHLLRRVQVVETSTLADEIDEAIDAGTFADADRHPLLMLDVVARGRDVKTREERYLAAEVSVGIGEGDILRAVDRASLLEKLTGIPAVPVVGGYAISSRFRSIADERHVQVVIAEEPK